MDSPLSNTTQGVSNNLPQNGVRKKSRIINVIRWGPSHSWGTILGVFAVYIFMISGCTRMTGPIPTLAPDETLATIVTSTAAPTQTLQPVEISPHGEYAVVWVPSDESLAARQPAGISGTILEELDWDARDVWLTENKTFLGSSLWLEILLEDELTGWVNAWNLTRYVPSEIFCRDPAVFSLLDDFQQIVKQGDAEGLEDLVDQDRGLTIRLSWYTPDVQYSIDEISTLFISKEEVEWGTMADSGVEISGSFEEVILTKLKNVFTGQHEMRCNQLGSGNTSGEVKWPDEFVNINYMSFFRPAEEGGNIFDWSTWAVGIEYFDGEPAITVLINYISEL